MHTHTFLFFLLVWVYLHYQIAFSNFMQPIMRLVSKSDAELWQAIGNDSEWAFAALFDRYWELLYNTSYRRIRNHEASEEIVHDIFLNIWERRKELQVGSFKNYLLTAVRYQVYNRMRSAKPAIIYTDKEPIAKYACEHNHGESRIHEHELRLELNSNLNDLPKRCQEIFNMSRINHLSNQEIASQLGISKRSVENQLTFALKHLRGCYKHLIYLIALYGIWR